MNKQIEEMAKHCHFYEEGKCLLLDEDSVECDMNCDMRIFAKILYNAGYRKQSEGEWVPKDNFNGRCTIAVCSNCGTEKALATLATIETVTRAFPYCEKCGAKMRKEDERK